MAKWKKGANVLKKEEPTDPLDLVNTVTIQDGDIITTIDDCELEIFTDTQGTRLVIRIIDYKDNPL